MDDLLKEFIAETHENMSKLDTQLVELEKNPNNPALVNEIFRIVHTIKGTCGFLGLPRLEAIAHSSENVLGLYRDGSIEVSGDSVSAILASLDQIKQIMDVLAETGLEPDGQDDEMIARLDAVAAGLAVPKKEVVLPPRIEKPKPVIVAQPAKKAEAPVAPEESAAEPEEAKTESPVVPVVAEKPKVTKPAIKPKASASEARVDDTSGSGSTKDGELKAAGDGSAAIGDQTVRVNVDVLNHLMDLMGELVLTRNQMLQILRSNDGTGLNTASANLNRVVGELQESVMKTRMQPIGNAWAKLPRIVRDLSVELGKKIDLRMMGAETEIDRQILEMIRDPLTHIVRNSADHALETPAERKAAGKPETGSIKLEAFHEGGQIVIRITDDGRGLNTAKIAKKAVEQGLATEADVERMTPSQIHTFIFKAGFSTADKVTNVSGRGVGMDVVRTNIEKIGGTIDLDSQPGKGAIFSIKIPLTLAIVSALIVKSSGQRFAVPQVNVAEVVRVGANSQYKMEWLQKTPMLRLREKMLPLVSLTGLLELGNDEIETATVVVTQVGTDTYGIIVDEVVDTEEIVVKPLSRLLKDAMVYSGNTILGDGSVVMILDANGVLAEVGANNKGAQTTEREEMHHDENDDAIQILVFRAGDGAPKAVPLSLVARLENLSTTKFEKAASGWVCQYLGRLMPIVGFTDEWAPAGFGDTSGADHTQHLIVFTEGERTMGLAVDEILEVVNSKVAIDVAAEKKGIIGSAIIDGKATDIVDIGHFLSIGSGNWFSGGKDTRLTKENRDNGARGVLIVDDSSFFRALLVPILQARGFDVRQASSANEALTLLSRDKSIRTVISDLEMPGGNGYQLAEKIRSSGDFREIKLIALSAHATTKDVERGRKSGFDLHLSKNERDTLFEILEREVGNFAEQSV
jgi:two-component system chemotaxis sensor kinase CheA